MAARYVRIGQYPDYRDEIRGTLAEILASTANPGTYAAPEDVAGCTLEMGADGLWTGASVGTLTRVQADALVASGAMATVKVGTPGNVSGVLYSWSGSAWVAVGGGGGLPVFANYDALPAPKLGLIAQIPRLCGNGYFALRANGTRWEVCLGESIIRDAGPASAGYSLTAAALAYTALASYTIPAGLIGDGEEWMATICMKSGATLVGTDYASVYLGGNAIAATALTGTSKQSIAQGLIFRLGGTMVRNHQSVSPTYASATLIDVSANFDSPQTISAGNIPATVGNIITLRSWVFGRAG